MKGHQRCAKRQAKDADIGGEPDPKQLLRVTPALAFGNGVDATGFQLSGTVPGC